MTAQDLARFQRNQARIEWKPPKREARKPKTNPAKDLLFFLLLIPLAVALTLL